MIFGKKIKKLVIGWICIFLILYFCLSLIFLLKSNSRDNNRTKTHATVISYDVWNLNSSGMKAYLQLVLQTDHYKNIAVLSQDHLEFLHVQSPPLTGIDKILYRLHIIGTKDISAPVFYKGQQIGWLKGTQFTRLVYPLSIIFISLLFIFLTAIFVLYLIFNRKLLEQQVTERTRKYHELVNLLPEMVLETDLKGKILFANEIALERFGIVKLANYEYLFNDYIKSETKELTQKNSISQILGESIEQHKYSAHGPDGTQFPVLVRSALIHTNGLTTGARIVIVDITERCALEEQLKRDLKMKSIGMMAGGVAHDLNNILSGVVNYPELMLLELAEDSKLRRYIEPMKEAGLRAAAVVADLLTVARGTAATREIACLNELIRDYMDSPEFKQLESLHPDLSYSLKLEPQLGNISCSIIHIRKCLMNLVINASEALSGIGRITISTANREIEELVTEFGTIAQGTYTVLSVHDTGSGILPSDLTHIFEPFYSKKKLGRSGTGLGLAVVWNAMQDHKGGVRVEVSEKGTTFELYFPYSNKEVETPIERSSWENYFGDGESILIIDDELQQRDIALLLLHSLKYQVHAVSTGEEAIDYLSRQSVDLLILDMVIGSGLNGRQTYEKILQTTPGQKAIIISGFSESSDVKKALELGAGRLINKPYTKEQLAMAVSKELGKLSI